MSKLSYNVSDCVPVWSLRPTVEMAIEILLKESWLGLVLRYQCHWGDNPKPPTFMVKEGTTLTEFREAVELEVKASGDDHHIFIESLVQNGMWLDIITGS